MSITLHERALLVQRCRNELSGAVCELWARHDLTPAEVVSMLANLTAEYTKYVLREERHPNDPDKKADEA